MSRFVSVAFALTLGASALVAQMPDSPTGRMAGALVDLAATSDPAAVEAFVADRVAAAAPATLAQSVAAFGRACAGGKPAMVRKSGAWSAALTLELPDGRCEVAYTVEQQAPHGLVELSVDVLMGGAPPAGLALDLPSDSAEAFGAALDRQLQDLAAQGAFSGVVLVARSGVPLFHRAYGLADRAAERPNTLDTRFDVGSITKFLTRIAIAQLAQAGKLDLSATVLSVLPDYPNPAVGSRITIQQMLDHSSGLGDIFNARWEAAEKSRFQAPRDFFPLFADQALLFEPGTSSSYSNAGFVVLGAIVEQISGEPFADYLARRVFAPAGMTASGFPARDGSDPGLAVGYTQEGGGEPRPNLGMLPLRGCPAGSSSHTAADLLALDQALRAGKLLDDRWTSWVFSGELVARPERDWQIGIAGGGPGVNAVLESGPTHTVVVVANLDPPVAGQVASPVARALGDG